MDGGLAFSALYIPIGIFLYFYWKKNGHIPFPMGVVAPPFIIGYTPGPPVVDPPPVVNPPTPVTPPVVNPPTPVTPPVVTPPTPNCPPCPQCPSPPPPPPPPPPRNYKQEAIQKLLAVPVTVTANPVLYNPGMGTSTTFNIVQNETIGDLPDAYKTFHNMQVTEEERGMTYTLGPVSVTPTGGRLRPTTVEAIEEYAVKRFKANH